MIFSYRPLIIMITAAVLSSGVSLQLGAQNVDALRQEEDPDVVGLTLQSAEELALTHNRDIMNAGIDIQKAEAQKWQAIATMLPQVSASLDYTSTFNHKMDFGQMSIAIPNTGTIGITSAVALSGSQVVGVMIANISKKMSDISLRKTRRVIVDEVRTLYCNALVLERTIELLEENHTSLKKLHEMSEASVSVGVSEQTAADQLLVQVNSMADNISSTKRSLEVVYNTMRLLLGMDDKVEIKLLQTLDSLVDEKEIKALLAEEFNIDNNYDYQLLAKSTELARRQMTLAGWSNGPTLSVFHQYSGKKYFSDEMHMDMTPPNTFGVQLNIPIFTSLKNTMNYKSAKLSYRQQLNTMKYMETSLRLQYRQQAYNLNSTMERYHTQEFNIKVARRVFDNTAKKYEYGVSSSMEVTQAMTSLVTAQSSYIQSLLEMVTAQISLAQLLNK